MSARWEIIDGKGTSAITGDLALFATRPFRAVKKIKCAGTTYVLCYGLKVYLFLSLSISQSSFLNISVCTYLGSLKRSDPLGHVIAILILTLFLLSLLTLCLKVCSNIFCHSSNGNRCIMIQCAVSLHCCCQWKAGRRLRIIPEGEDQEDSNSSNIIHEGFYHPHQPPPSYIDIFPDTGPPPGN